MFRQGLLSSARSSAKTNNLSEIFVGSSFVLHSSTAGLTDCLALARILCRRPGVDAGKVVKFCSKYGDILIDYFDRRGRPMTQPRTSVAHSHPFQYLRLPAGNSQLGGILRDLPRNDAVLLYTGFLAKYCICFSTWAKKFKNLENFWIFENRP